MNEWFEHGSRVDSIPVDDRGLQYGDGLFETIAIRDARPRFWSAHVDRLTSGAERLGLTLPVANILQRDLERALALTTINTGFCTAKIVITAGVGPRGYRREAGRPTRTLVGVFDGAELPRDHYAEGVETVLCETPMSDQPLLAGLKTLNRLDQVLASREWESGDAFDGLMCDSAERLVCGTRTNLFLIRDNQIMTPALDRCGVAGIMRRQILDGLSGNQIECAVTDIPAAALDDADEVFVCNSQIGVLPVRRCGTRSWPVGEGTQSIMAMMAYNDVPECTP
ncbi:MAG: aminodeoxychorismate lyase [Woeseiaceae bacterium]|nr:aminodeoxychorismate lyase [Woeseiaceae bacterium]